MAEAVNNITQLTAAPLFTQNQADGQIKTALLALQQELDLHQKQIELLWQTVHLQCDVCVTAVCVTSVPILDWETRYHNLSVYIRGPWYREFSQIEVDSWDSILEYLRFHSGKSSSPCETLV